jgi:hypothetical protein
MFADKTACVHMCVLAAGSAVTAGVVVAAGAVVEEAMVAAVAALVLAATKGQAALNARQAETMCRTGTEAVGLSRSSPACCAV